MQFVFDLDGTLCFDRHQIDEEIRLALQEAIQQGHSLSFATARSYRDCLSLLEGGLSQQLVIGLNGGVAYQAGRLLLAKELSPLLFQTLIRWCQTYNLPYFIDDSFDYTCSIPEKIPFISNVDPLKQARRLPLGDLKQPIKAVIYMGDHEELVEDLTRDLKRLDCASIFYHELEKCLYVNPLDTTKASTIGQLIGQDYIAFGNDKNDKDLFKQALYAVQVGNYKPLRKYADETILPDQEVAQTVAASIRKLSQEFAGR